MTGPYHYRGADEIPAQIEATRRCARPEISVVRKQDGAGYPIWPGRQAGVGNQRKPAQIGGSAPAAPQDQDGDADHHRTGCGADHYGVDLTKALADPVYGALGTLLRAHPVGYGVDGVRQLVAGAVDVRHQCVLIDVLRFEVRVSHYVLRFQLG